MIGIFLLYACVCVVVYFEFVQPWINGTIDIRIGADSDRYWEVARRMQEGNYPISTFAGLTTLTGNFLGPVVLILLLKNGFLIMCFNFVVLYIAFKVASSIEHVRITMFGFLMLLNAELFPALTTVNKEILALLAAVLSAKYIYSTRRSKLFLFAALLVSLFARWEQAGILIVFLLFSHSPLRSRPKLSLALLIAALTVTYPLLFSMLGVDSSIFDYLLQDAHLVVTLNSIQLAYGFPIVLIPKVLMSLAGRLSTPWKYWNGEFAEAGFADVQQQIFQPLGCLAILIAFTFAFFKKRLNLRNPIAFFIAITLIISVVPPFIQPRYLYGVYVLLSLELARCLPASPEPHRIAQTFRQNEVSRIEPGGM
jgi:hypothetical protein